MGINKKKRLGNFFLQAKKITKDHSLKNHFEEKKSHFKIGQFFDFHQKMPKNQPLKKLIFLNNATEKDPVPKFVNS